MSTHIIHPLEPLSAEELRSAVSILRGNGKLTSKIRIISITLKEPAKESVLNWPKYSSFDRQAFAVLFDNGKNLCQEAEICLKSKTITKFTDVPGVQPSLSFDEMLECEQVVLKSPEVLQVLKKHYNLHSMDGLTVDIWSAGYYGPEDEQKTRLARPLLFLQDNAGNRYAKPLEAIRLVVDLNAMKVLHIEEHGQWPLPPEDIRAEGMKHRQRNTGLKPLEIIQPEGASFRVNGNVVEWEKWQLVVGFTAREGLTLHDIRLDGRSILYRAAMAEMLVPYGDPSPQQARKNAFDVSDYGIGTCANSLKLGCDCLGLIHYFNAELVTSRGDLWTIENAVCLHEEDFGILWKHTERGQHSNIRRSRRLSISFFATVENYDYGFYWYFYQDGTIEFEVKLTGILSLGALQPNEVSKYGTTIAPQVCAPYHQHIFGMRLDFAIDGPKNRVYQVDVKPDTKNPYKNGFFAEKTLFENELQARSKVCLESARSWRIENAQKMNALNQPVAYSLIAGENTVPFAAADAWWRQRARFIDYHVWVTPFAEREMFPAGEYPNQHPGGEGVYKWTQANRCLVDQDLVVWYTMGTTHIPRPEDYPLMPVARLNFMLKPFGFFDHNPAQDVPPQCLINKKSESVRAKL